MSTGDDTNRDPAAELLAGRYRLVRRLGAGGMASVHLAEDVRLGRLVAVKRLHAESPDETVKRFRREARLAASFAHPNLVQVYDAQTVDGNVLIVMEYVEGETLAKAIHRGPLEPARALAVLEGVAAALDAAHERGVVHRDVKPANVLLGVDGGVKLTDLGVASAASSTRITQVGSVLGTLSYMAPEQLTEQPVTPAADIYALAAVAYEALSGRKARPGESPVAIMLQAEDAAPPDLLVATPDAPPAAARVLQRGMARDPAERPASAGALVDQLRTAFAPEASMPQSSRSPVAATPSRGRRTRALLALAGLLAAGVIVAIVLASSSGGGRGGSAASSTTQHRAAAGTPKGRTSTSPSAQAQPAALSPADTVRAFYERAANGRLGDSYALLAPQYKAQFGSFAEFRRELGTLRSVRFSALRTVQQSSTAAVVELQDVATHTDRVDHCQGQLALVRSGGGWLINPRSVNCA